VTTRLLKYFLLFNLILAFILPNIQVFSQEKQQGFTQEIEKINLEEICQSMEEIDKECRTLSTKDCRNLLEKCEKYFQEISAQYEKDISKTQQERKTLQNQIYILKQKVSKLNYQIQESNVVIRDVSFQIEDTKFSIEVISGNIEDSRQKLANILRLIYEEDQKSLPEILILGPELSDFFENLAALQTLGIESSQLLQDIKESKSQLEIQEEALESEKTDLEKLLAIQILQKKESERVKSEKDYLLEETKGQETLYQKYLREAQGRAAEIRKRIFELAGVPKAPTFGEALDLARYVEGITGVRPALLLAVLTQESNIGKNVGQCYLSGSKTGEGITINGGKKMPKTMHPSRDIPHFLNIAKALGRDPYATPVSCPMSFGWGGAMGPAQFIPSTWMIYKDRVAEITGKTADPWDIRDSFLAAALYLADYGAARQTYNDEWKAAMIYFSGSTNPRYSFYGDSVMSLATRYQADIETLEKAK
jgi:membrane-bound lytic murein transglycosylase B